MAVKTGVASQALGFVEEKLRRVFRLAGPIGCDLDPVVKPVIVVDDLRDPGHAFFQGRSFAWSVNGVGIAAGTKYCQVRFTNDVVLEGVWIHGPVLGGASFVQAYIGAPGEAVPNNAEFLTGMWRDNRALSTDQPPIQGAVSFAALSGGGTPPATANTFLQCAAGGTLPGYVPMKMYIPAQGWLAFTIIDVASISVGCFGRIWPQ